MIISPLAGQPASERPTSVARVQFTRVCVVTPHTGYTLVSAPGCAPIVCDLSTNNRHLRAVAAIGRRLPLPRRYVTNNAPSCWPFVTFSVLTDGNFKHSIEDASLSGFC